MAEAAARAAVEAREFDVARLITEGRTNAEIAAELSIAPKTVGSHVEHILVKLTATRRTEVAAWVSRLPAAPDDAPAADVSAWARAGRPGVDPRG